MQNIFIICVKFSTTLIAVLVLYAYFWVCIIGIWNCSNCVKFSQPKLKAYISILQIQKIHTSRKHCAKIKIFHQPPER